MRPFNFDLACGNLKFLHPGQSMKPMPMVLLIAGVWVLGFSRLAGAQSCYKSVIVSPSPFMGNNGEILRLADQSVWEVKNEYEYLYAYYPSVIICPREGKLIIEKRSLYVQSVGRVQKESPVRTQNSIQDGVWSVFEETNLEGSISGTVNRGRIFKTTSGRVFEVTGLTLQLVLALEPKVLILRNGSTYKLIVEGFDEPLICRRLDNSQLTISPETQEPRTTITPSVVEARVDGVFNGWEGETIVKLNNGQIWQQSEYYYHYHYAYGPNVIVYKSGAGYKMKIDGIEKAVGVVLLR